MLAESALELVPATIAGHQAVVADARRKGVSPGRLLLDSNYHHAAMAGLDLRDRRGRPDIPHACLLNAMNTPLDTVHRAMRACIHVERPCSAIIEVAPGTRIPRSPNRWDGLMSGLLARLHAPGSAGDVAGKDPGLLSIRRCSLDAFLERFGDRVHVFSRAGVPGSFTTALPAIGASIRGRATDIALVIGGFQAGQFASPAIARVPRDRWHAIAPVPLDAWTVVARVVFMVEAAIEGRPVSC